MQSLATHCHTRTSRKTLTPSPAEPHSMTSTTKPPARTLSHDSAIYLILSHSAMSYMMSTVNISGADFNVYNGLGLKFFLKKLYFHDFSQKKSLPQKHILCSKLGLRIGTKTNCNNYIDAWKQHHKRCAEKAPRLSRDGPRWVNTF